MDGGGNDGEGWGRMEEERMGVGGDGEDGGGGGVEWGMGEDEEIGGRGGG